ncbi:MAG: CsgG/HfaB family protein [bacterium]|nr:CsgG/HfaB family protein [bacterium]
MWELFRKKKIILLVCAGVFLNVGCGGNMRTYLKDEAPLHKVKKLALLEFNNMSKDKNAGEKLAYIFAIELMTSSQFKVIEPGEVDKALKEVKVRAKGGVNTLELADAQKIGEALGVDAVILGTIDTFEMGKKDDPVISMDIHMLDTKDGSLIWQVNYIATGSDFAYLLDFGKITTTEMLSRKMVQQLLAPIIKKSKNSLREAKVKINNAKLSMEKAENNAKDLKSKSEELDVQARDAEERSKDLESRVKQQEQEALRINPEALARKVSELQDEIKAADNELTALIAVSKKKVTAKSSVESKLKEVEAESKGYKDKLDEITGQINIFTAKERVARIRGNNEEADDYKKKADAAKVEAKDIQEKYDASQKSLENSAKELNALAPDVKKAQDNEKVVSEKVDSLKAQLAEVEKMQKELPPEISPEQIKVAKEKEAEVKLLKAEAAKVKSDSIRLRDLAEQLRKQSAKAAEDSEASKKLYEDTRAKLE